MLALPPRRSKFRRKSCAHRDDGLTQIESDVLPLQRLPRYRSRYRKSQPRKILEAGAMNLSEIGIRRLLQVSSALVVVGLALEIVSLLWFHPLSFVLFAFVAATLIGLGVLVYLVSLVFAAAPHQENRN